MKNEFQKSLDIAINESSKPILIIGNFGDGKVTYLKDNYNTYCLSALNIYLQLFGNENIEKSLLRWKETCDKFSKNKSNNKFLIVFDELDKLFPQTFSRFISKFVIDESKYTLPDNSLVVGIINTPNLRSIKIIDEYAKYFTIVNGFDKSYDIASELYCEGYENFSEETKQIMLDKVNELKHMGYNPFDGAIWPDKDQETPKKAKIK